MTTPKAQELAEAHATFEYTDPEKSAPGNVVFAKGINHEKKK